MICWRRSVAAHVCRYSLHQRPSSRPPPLKTQQKPLRWTRRASCYSLAATGGNGPTGSNGDGGRTLRGLPGCRYQGWHGGSPPQEDDVGRCRRGLSVRGPCYRPSVLCLLYATFCHVTAMCFALSVDFVPSFGLCLSGNHILYVLFVVRSRCVGGIAFWLVGIER